MGQYYVDEAGLREPNLLIPGRKPVGAVKIDWANSGLENDILAWYLMNDSGTSLTDIAAGNAGTLIGSVSRGPQDLLFAGGRVSLPITIQQQIDAAEELTIIAWVYVTSDAADGTVVGCWAGTGNFLFWADVGGSGKGYACIVRTAAKLVRAGEDVASLTLNTWQCVAVTYAAPTLRIYVDGVQVASDTGGSTIDASITAPAIGSDGAAVSDRAFTGKMKDVRIWKKALSATSIYNHYIDPYQFLIPA